MPSAMNIFSKISNLKQSLSQRTPQFEDKYLVQNPKADLGNGSFATVFSCHSKEQSERQCDVLAVKVFDRKSQSGLRREFRNERKLNRMVSTNEHCVKMLDAFESHRFCHIVMEKAACSVQEAFSKASKCGHTSEKDLAHVFKCMLLGLQHLHECGLVHRDIKPANLLLAKNESFSNRPVVKVCDLGLGAELPRRGMGLTEVCGTAPYMSPEMLKRQPYRVSVDLWSCGVTAYVMLLGGFPYQCGKCNTNLMKTTIIEGKVQPTFKANPGTPAPSDEAIAFLKMLLNRDPELRAGCDRSLNSSYISNLTKPNSVMMPSFGPTLSIAHDTTKDEPAAETPIVKGLDSDTEEELSSSESTDCGSVEEDSEEKHRCGSGGSLKISEEEYTPPTRSLAL